MATEVRNFAVTVPVGTAIANPQLTNLTMPSRVVRGVRVRIPPGPKGVVGWALAASGTPIIPWGSGQWMVQDDEIVEWPLDNQIDSGAWQLRAYNTGLFAHTIYVTFLLDPLPSRTPLPGATAPLVLEA